MSQPNEKHASPDSRCDQNRNYHSLFEQARDAIMVTDYRGDFKDVNTALCGLFGYSREELLGMNINALIDAGELKERPIRFDLLARGETILNERKMVRKNGAPVYVEANVKKIADDRVLAIARDITERKKMQLALEKSEADLHTILDTTDTVYVLMDQHLRIISYNPKAAGFAKRELGHQRETSPFILDYFSGKKKELLSESLQKALTGEKISYEALYPQKNGTANWYHVRILPAIRTGTAEGVMIVASDITEKKNLEKELLLNKTLEQIRMVRTALKAQEMERNKIGQELHDNVNQILASTRLYINMMQDGGSAPVDLSQRLKSGIDLAISEIRKLSNAHITPPEKMGLQELIENLVSSLNENEMVATVFQCQIQEDLIIDQELRTNLYRIVQEQTNNILKYAKASSASITISCEQDRLKMVIADNGKGFDMAASRNGIGIYNMINRVSSFNGELQIETAPGTGCTIRVSIPLHA